MINNSIETPEVIAANPVDFEKLKTVKSDLEEAGIELLSNDMIARGEILVSGPKSVALLERVMAEINL